MRSNFRFSGSIRQAIPSFSRRSLSPLLPVLGSSLTAGPRRNRTCVALRPSSRTPAHIRALPLILCLSLLPTAVAASCGLAYCPVGAKPGSYAVGLQWRMAAFHAAGQDISIQQGVLRLEWLPHNLPLHLGLDLAMTAPSERLTSAGWANPLAFVEMALPTAGPLGAAQFALGLQAELPFGDNDGGYASDHAMGVPYVTFRYPLGNFAFTARAGWAVALSTHHEDEASEGEATVAALPQARIAHARHGAHEGHDAHAENAEAPVFVEPHSDNDALFLVGLEWTRGFATLGAAVHQATALATGFSPRHAWAGAFSCRFDFGGRFQAIPEVRFPLGEEGRIEGAGGIALRTLF